MWDTGATTSIVSTEHENLTSDKRPSRMICKGAFDAIDNKAKSNGTLKMWAINDPSKKTIDSKSYRVVKKSPL